MKLVETTLKELNHFIKGKGVQGQIRFRGEVSHMVRCGRNQISLNVSSASSLFQIQLQKGKKLISSELTCHQNDTSSCKKLIEKLYKDLSFMPELDYLRPMNSIAQGSGLYSKQPLDEQEPIPSKNMVEFFKRIGTSFDLDQVEISGAFSAGHYYYCLINTEASEPIGHYGSDYNVEAVLQLLRHDKKELRVSSVGCSLNDFTSDSLVQSLKEQYILKTQTPRIDISLEKYDIIFSKDAIAELTMYCSYAGFSGEYYEFKMGMFQKGRQKIGDQLFGDNINIHDDPKDETHLFNREIGLNGIKRSSFPLIENGVLKNLYYSNKEKCDRFDKEVNNDFNVSSISLGTGNGPNNIDEISKSIKKPTLLINYIHYMNFTNIAKGEFTGTSRFGSYLIEPNKGIKQHLYNLRLNDSLLRVFNNIIWLSKDFTHVNLSQTYGHRNAKAIKCPKYMMVSKVPITATSAPRSKNQ